MRYPILEAYQRFCWNSPISHFSVGEFQKFVVAHARPIRVPTLYRGVTAPVFYETQNGDVIPNPSGVSSWTYDPEVASMYAGSGIVLRLEAQIFPVVGIDVEAMLGRRSYYPEEREYILVHSKYQILAASKRRPDVEVRLF